MPNSGLCPPASRLAHSPHDGSPQPVVRTTLFTRLAEFRSVPSCLTTHSQSSRLLSSSSSSHNSHHVSCRIQVCALLPHDSLTVRTTALVIQLFAQLSSRVWQNSGLCLPASRLTRSTLDCSYHPCRMVPGPTTSSFVFCDCSYHASCRIQVCTLLSHAHSQFSQLFTSSSCSANSVHASCGIQVCALLPHAFSQSSRLLSS